MARMDNDSLDLNQRLQHWLLTSQRHARQSMSGGSSRPFVTLCYAQSWDGSITTSPGETLALSSHAALQMTHHLRSLHDGILVGIGTVLADNPRLTVREWPGESPQPIVLDSRLRMPANSQLCQHNHRRCWVLTTTDAVQPRQDCELIAVPADDEGHVDLAAALQALGQRGMQSVMVEGGANVISAFLRRRLADAIVLTVAPVLVGGYNAIGRLVDPRKASFPHIAPLFSQQLENEMIVWGSLNYRDGEP